MVTLAKFRKFLKCNAESIAIWFCPANRWQMSFHESEAFDALMALAED